jgi:cytidylate kinase
MIVTISRQMGSEGDAIAARVSAALNLELVDRAYVRVAAREAGVAEALLQRLMYEGQRSVAAEILESLGAPRTQSHVSAQSASPLLNVFAPMLPPVAMTLEEAARGVGLVIKHVASRGNLLVLGQAGQVLLHGYPGACHVQVIAPLAVRSERIARRENVALTIARRRIRASDDARATYLARYYDVRWQDPLLYHLVINTGRTSIEGAVSLIAHAAQVCANS